MAVVAQPSTQEEQTGDLVGGHRRAAIVQIVWTAPSLLRIGNIARIPVRYPCLSPRRAAMLLEAVGRRTRANSGRRIKLPHRSDIAAARRSIVHCPAPARGSNMYMPCSNHTLMHGHALPGDAGAVGGKGAGGQGR